MWNAHRLWCSSPPEHSCCSRCSQSRSRASPSTSAAAETESVAVEQCACRTARPRTPPRRPLSATISVRASSKAPDRIHCHGEFSCLRSSRAVDSSEAEELTVAVRCVLTIERCPAFTRPHPFDEPVLERTNGTSFSTGLVHSLHGERPSAHGRTARPQRELSR